MFEVIYIGARVSGEYEGRHYEYTPIVVVDDRARPSIEKVRDASLLNGIKSGELIDIYYDTYGKITYISRKEKK